jgi:hypothetical protein
MNGPAILAQMDALRFAGCRQALCLRMAAPLPSGRELDPGSLFVPDQRQARQRSVLRRSAAPDWKSAVYIVADEADGCAVAGSRHPNRKACRRKPSSSHDGQ